MSCDCHWCKENELKSRLAAAERDAARYRFIRDKLAIGIGDPCMFVVEFFQGDQPTFDAAIDAMMAHGEQ